MMLFYACELIISPLSSDYIPQYCVNYALIVKLSSCTLVLKIKQARMQFLIHLLWIFQVRLPNRVAEVSFRKMSHQNKADQSKVTRLREKSDCHTKVSSKTSQIWPHEGIIKIVITHILGREFVGWAHSHVYVSTRHNNAVQSSNNNPDFCFNFVCYRHQLAGVELKNFQPLHITPPASHL